MALPKRYFLNNFPDYNGGSVTPDKSDLKAKTLQLTQTISGKWAKIHQNCDGGLYVGLAGAVYMLHRLSKIPDFASERNYLLKEAVAYLKPTLDCANYTKSQGNKVDIAAFLLGNAGAYAVGAVLYNALDNAEECKKCLSEFAQLAPVVTPVNWLSCGGDEFLVGRAGYLAGVLWLQSELQCNVLQEGAIHAILDAMLESGCQYSKAHRSPMPLMYQYYKTEYLGAAHGLAGILQIMLSFPSWLASRPQAKELIKKSLDVLLQLQTPSGNFPCAMDELDDRRHPDDELVHWCHGAPGTVYLLGKAYMVYREEKYLNACLKCGEITWQKGLLKKGPGICHGVAGSGYVFLTLYRLTKDPIHLYRALQFSSFLYAKEFQQARIPDAPYSLFEGLAGTVCFLADLMDPENAVFPLFNIF
ncbi:lanC-like protein 3 [Penaeus chinensis]|uniref:lanC-like protein 3 n=1 Tax=Penaeus chinensis TaxID=139456 RepID=UPI001FB58CF3|nr:lanC-like protein 3 [Penaeus chinensis]